MWFAIVSTFLILIILFVCLQIAFSIVLPKTRNLEMTRELELKKDETLFDFYDNYLTKEKNIKSRYGYNLTLYYFLNPESKKFIVIAHGHTYTHHGGLKYARMMADYGYNVVLYDQRYHGKSGGKNSTLGYYEKNDLYDIISKVYLEFGDDIILGTYGESMGAATVLLEQALDKRVFFCISDCSFFSLNRLIKEQLKSRKVPRVFYPAINWFVKIITGVKLEEVSPIESLANSVIPILFIHGKQDKLINYQHSVDMYNSYQGKKELFIASNNATHAYSFFSDNEEYKMTVKRFVEENVNEEV